MGSSLNSTLSGVSGRSSRYERNIRVCDRFAVHKAPAEMHRSLSPGTPQLLDLGKGSTPHYQWSYLMRLRQTISQFCLEKT